MLRELVRDDDGVALITVVGVIAVITIISVLAFTLATQSLTDSARTQRQTDAFQAANAGIDAVQSEIERLKGGDQVLGELPHVQVEGEVSSSHSTYSAGATYTADAEYLAISTGTSATGARETIQVKFFYLNLYDMNLAAGSNQSLTAGGGGINGTSNVTGPFYVRGSVELGGTSFVHNGPLFVKDGSITLQSNSSEIGEASNPIRVYVSDAYPSTDNFHASSISQAVPLIQLPKVDESYMDTQWSNARKESCDNIMGPLSRSEITNLESTDSNPLTYTTMQPPSSATWTRSKAPGSSNCYKYIGPEAGYTKPLGTGTAALHLGRTGSFGSWGASGARAGDGHYSRDSHDDFAFNDDTNVLYVEGTVLVDGPLYIDEDITYVGNGAIVANGPIVVNGAVKPDVGFDAANTDHQALGLVTPTTITINYQTGNTKDMSQPPDMAGAFFAKEKIAFTSNGLLFKGSIIAGNISFEHPNVHLVTNPLLPAFLPENMPGRGDKILIRGAWARL